MSWTTWAVDWIWTGVVVRAVPILHLRHKLTIHHRQTLRSLTTIATGPPVLHNGTDANRTESGLTPFAAS